MLIAPQQLTGERRDDRSLTGSGSPHHRDATTRVAAMLDRGRPNEPQVTMGFHGRERVAAVNQLLRRHSPVLRYIQQWPPTRTYRRPVRALIVYLI